MFKYLLIELQEDDRIPLMILVEDDKSKFQIPQPFSDERTTLVKHISDTRKEQLKEEIKTFEACLLFMEETTTYLNTFEKNQDVNKFEENYEKKYFIQSFSDLLIGGRTFKKILSSYNYYSKIKEKKEKVEEEKDEKTQKQSDNPNQQKINKSNVAILIYQGESEHDLNETISYFKGLKIIPIILINCKKHFQQLFQEDDIYKDYFNMYIKYSFSTDHSFFLEKQDENGKFEYYFSFFMQLDTLQLIRWIYLGILSFIDPEYVVILKSDFILKFRITDLFSLFCQEQTIFGIQLGEQLLVEDESLKQLSYYIQIPKSIIGFHSKFKIKQFHNPLQCIYKWSLISNQMVEYYSLLQKAQKTNIGVLGLNSILPMLMLTQQKQLELHHLSKPVLTLSINQLPEKTLIDHFVEARQNIHYQMQNYELITSNWKIYLQVSFQNAVCKLQFISGYFAISVCKLFKIQLGFFFAFYSPYQLIYNTLKQSSLYTFLAMLIPICYSFNVFVFILISIIFNFQDKIELENKDQIFYVLNYNELNEIEFKSSRNNSDFQFQEDFSQINSQLNCKIKIQKDDISLELKKSFSINDENNREYILKWTLSQTLEINTIIMRLINIQKIFDFAVFLSTFFNLIFSYGKHLWDYSVVYKSLIILLAFIVIKREWCNQRNNLLTYTYKFSFLTYFWQIQNINSKKYLPQVQLARKQQLAQLLLTNAIVFYIFFAIEAYNNYSGYIFLGILGCLFYTNVTYSIQDQPFEKHSRQQIYPKNLYQIKDTGEEKSQIEIKFQCENTEKQFSIALNFINILNRQKYKQKIKQYQLKQKKYKNKLQLQNKNQNIQNQNNQQGHQNNMNIKK